MCVRACVCVVCFFKLERAELTSLKKSMWDLLRAKIAIFGLKAGKIVLVLAQQDHEVSVHLYHQEQLAALPEAINKQAAGEVLPFYSFLPQYMLYNRLSAMFLVLIRRESSLPHGPSSRGGCQKAQQQACLQTDKEHAGEVIGGTGRQAALLLPFDVTGVQFSQPSYNFMRESCKLSSPAALQMDSFKGSACWSGCHSNYW